MPDVSEPLTFLLTTLLLFLIIIGRYFLVGGLFYAIFYRWYSDKWSSRKINDRQYPKGQFRKEMFRSSLTGMLFALSGSLSILLWQKGWIKVYVDAKQYQWWWIPLSLGLFLAIHETYYYWLHRWMHRPKIFRIVHRMHHDSHIASPWTAFSFHPLEGLLQAIFLPLFLLIVPMYVGVLLLILMVMTLSSVINHLDIEIFPSDFHKHKIGRWLIGATHHSLHHKQYKFNFGLYFTFWDKWKRTESPYFEKLFEAKTKGNK